jgi:hypothetical protein
VATEYAITVGGLVIGDRSLSIDGRFVTYGKNNNGSWDALLADTCVGAAAGCAISSSALVSPAVNTQPALALTADGRFAAYSRPSLFRHVFAHDTCIGAAAGCALKDVRISESDAGVAAERASFNPTLSADGGLAAFASDATTLMAGDTNSHRDIFIARTGLSQ